MKRPLCVGCGILLALLLVSALLPQAAFWVPAAFVLAAGVALCFRPGRRMLGGCLCAAAVLAACCLGVTLLRRLPAHWLSGQTAVVQAQVRQMGNSYVDGMVSAQLALTAVDGQPVSLLCSCPCLPECEVGQQISGTFTLAELGNGANDLSLLADGVFAEAEYVQGFACVQQAQGWRAAFYRVRLALSENIRRYLSPRVGGVLAAMTVGDRRFLPADLTKSYRAAGVPHILVVSGLHLSLLCMLVPLHRQRRASRVARGLSSIAIALLLMGVTGGTPSILRAGLAVLICGLGLLLDQPADPVTSLAVSGAVLAWGNAYAVWDIAFQLSFAATAGVLLAGAGLAKAKREHPPKPGFFSAKAWALAEAAAASGMATAFTVPVLAFWGLSLSTVSLLTNLAVLWLVPPIVVCGMVAALAGCLPGLVPVLRGVGYVGGLLVQLLNGIVARLAAVPGAQLHPETGYPVVVFLLLAAFFLAGWRWGLPLRKLLPAGALLFCLAVGVNAALYRDLIKIALVGNAATPAVVVTQHGQAAVVFRGGSSNAQKVGEYLEQQGIAEIELLIDARMSPSGACPLVAARSFAAADAQAAEAHNWRLGDLLVLGWSDSKGCRVYLIGGEYRALVLSGQLPENDLTQPVQLLLASSGDPKSYANAQAALSLSENFRWLDNCGIPKVYYGESGAALWLRPTEQGRRWPARITGAY